MVSSSGEEFMLLHHALRPALYPRCLRIEHIGQSNRVAGLGGGGTNAHVHLRNGRHQGPPMVYRRQHRRGPALPQVRALRHSALLREPLYAEAGKSTAASTCTPSSCAQRTFSEAACIPASATHALTAEGDPNVMMRADRACASRSGGALETPRCNQRRSGTAVCGVWAKPGACAAHQDEG